MTWLEEVSEIIDLGQVNMVTGTCGHYLWAEWPDGCLWDLIEAVPDLFLGKFLVNTSFDSGFITLTPEAIAKGWCQLVVREASEQEEQEDKRELVNRVQRVTLSPRIKELNEVPYDCYDEWYVYPAPVSPELFERCEVFVNWCGFSLLDPGYEMFQGRFWEQLLRLNPETYLAESGENLICATCNSGLIGRISLWDAASG